MKRGPIADCTCRPCVERRKRQREYIERVKGSKEYKDRVRLNNQRQNSKRRKLILNEEGNEAWKMLMR